MTGFEQQNDFSEEISLMNQRKEADAGGVGGREDSRVESCRSPSGGSFAFAEQVVGVITAAGGFLQQNPI